jgi:hypothetical protein
MCPEIAETSLIGLALATSIAKLYSFTDFGLVQEVFSGRIRPENAVWMRGAHLLPHSSSCLLVLKGPPHAQQLQLSRKHTDNRLCASPAGATIAAA